MTFAHPLIGLILGKEFGHVTAYVAGSVFPDIDHLVVLIKNKHYHPLEAYRAMKDEKKYGESYKTVFTHSILAWLIFFGSLFLINRGAGLAFGTGYFIHLILDAVDTDEKQYFYPLKFKFTGFLPVFSYFEILSTIILVGIYLFTK